MGDTTREHSKRRPERPERRKSDDRPRYNENRDAKPKSKRAKELPDGVIAPFRRKEAKSAEKPAPNAAPKPQSKLRKGASDPSKPMRAPKVGKFDSKKNKARRAEATMAGKGADSRPTRRQS